MTILQFIVIEYQSLQNINNTCKKTCLQTVASIYIDSTKIRRKFFILPGTAFLVQPLRAPFVGTIYRTRIAWLEMRSRSALSELRLVDL